MATTTDEAGALIAQDIFQVLLCSQESFASPPREVARNFASVRDAHPAARHHVLNAEDIRSALRANFDADVLAAFDQLVPNSTRSNLARYCLLWLHGGLYVDIGVRFINPLRGPPGSALVAFRDYWGSATTGNAIAQGVLLAKAGRPELKTAIEMIVANVKNRYYGVNPIDVAGPGLFARAVAHHADGAACWFGQYLPVAPETRLKNFVFLTPDGEIVALGKSGAGGDLSYLGLSDVNNYVDIWRTRQVYGETTRTWRHDAAQLNTQSLRRPDGIHYGHGKKGFVLYGPYCALPAGHYRAVLRFAPGSTVAGCSFDVAAVAGTRPFARILTGEAEILDSSVAMSFKLEEAESDVECRMWCDGSDEGQLLELTIASV